MKGKDYSRISRRMAKLRDLKTAFKKNWQIFRESKIGVFGLGIIVFFVVMGFLAPFLGLRDPVTDYADTRDIARVTKEWDEMVGNVSTPPLLQREATSLYATVEMVYVAVNTPEGSYVVAFKTPSEYDKSVERFWRYPEPPVTLPTVNAALHLNPRGTLTLEDDVIYVLSGNTVYALSASSRSEAEGGTAGKLLWQFNASSNIQHQVGVDFDKQSARERQSPARFKDLPEYHRLFVSTVNGTLYALWDNYTDVICNWSLQVASSPLYTAVADEDTVYCAAQNGTVVAYYIDNKTVRWRYNATEHFSNSPAYDYVNDRLYIGDVSGGLHLIDAKTGVGYRCQLYLKPGLKDTGRLTQPFVRPGGEVVYVASTSRMLYAVWSDGSPQWNVTLHGVPVGSPTCLLEEVRYHSIYIATFDGVYGRVATYASNGTIQWVTVVSADGNKTSPPSISGNEKVGGIGNVYVGSSDGCLRAYDLIGEYLAPLPPGNYKYSGWFLLGTDDMGRDILSQLIWGSRIALLVGLSAAFFSVLIGTIVGLVAGYFGGGVDTVLMRFTDVILVLPALPLLIVLAALLGPSVWNIVFIIAIVGWPGTARVIRSAVLSLKERPFIESARVTGASHARIMFKHIAPNVIPLAFLFMTFGVTGAILAEASLSFLGLGDPTCMSWGMMLNYLFQSGTVLRAWWWLMPPGLSITFVCLGFFLVGHAVEPIVNPRLRKR